MAQMARREARRSPKIRVSYTQGMFTPKAFNAGDVPKYGMTLMIDKTNKEQMAFLALLHQDLVGCLNEQWPDEATRPRNPLFGGTRSPIKDGDTTVDSQGIPLAEKNPEYAGHWIIRVGSTSKPAVVDRNRVEITDQSRVYGGCWGIANLNAYAYNFKELQKGATFGLNGFQLLEDGEPFGGGRPPVDKMFEAVTPDQTQPAAAGPDPFAGLNDAALPEDEAPPF